MVGVGVGVGGFKVNDGTCGNNLVMLLLLRLPRTQKKLLLRVSGRYEASSGQHMALTCFPIVILNC